MNTPAQSRRFPPVPSRPARRSSTGLLYGLLAVVCLLVATAFYWFSKQQSANQRQVAEQKQESPAPAPANYTLTTATAARPHDGNERAAPVQASEPTQKLNGAYSILPPRAYFYAAPRAASSTAKYLLRGDIVYAEGESGDFIQTRFYNAGGDPIAGWLRKADVQAVRKKAPQTAAAAPANPSRSAPAQRVPAVPRETKAALPASSAAAAPFAATGVVRADTTYFYDSPDLTQRRRAFCIRGDKLRLGESSEKAVFATFVNWEKVTTKGWIRKADLTIR